MREVIAGGAVQAVVIVLGAFVGVWLDRRYRYRRDVEDATLRLLNAVHMTMTGFVAGGLDTTQWQQQWNLTQELLMEIRAKTRGYRRTKRSLINTEARQLHAGLGALWMMVDDRKPISDQVLTKVTTEKLHAAVFGEDDVLYEDLQRWRELLEPLA